ncbi:MAG: formate dehydrogenase subunit alpha [Aquisalimonadaceae bacterium]
MKRFTGSAVTAATPVPVNEVATVCPYCGVGCAVSYVADGDGRVLYGRGRDGSANAGRLCVKGRYGVDYAAHPQRLTRPLIRRETSYPKGPLSAFSKADSSGPRKPGSIVDYDEVLPHFREASWDEALDLVARRLLDIRQQHGADSLAGFGSAKGSNEEAYLFQKLVRAVFGTNNVDHCTRLCHASSVYALIEGLGSGAVTNVVRDVENADVAVLSGCNPTANHPVAASFIKDAAEKGTKLLVVNVRRPPIADFAEQYVQIRPGTDVAFYNGVLHVLIEEGLYDSGFVAARTEGFEDLRAVASRYTPALAGSECGVPAEEIVRFARTLGSAATAMFFWGMGISQHVFGTNNARCLIALALLTGNVGRPGTGLHPLRGQNNVQGASDAGLIPMYYPGYQSVTDDSVRARFEQLWGVPLSASAGLTTVEITHGALDGRIRGLYCQGENPFMSDPDINKVREALSNLEFLVVQDIFLTETAEFADVILPASSALEKTGTYTNTDRRVQIGRPVRGLPGEARQDWEILCEVANRMGYAMNYADVSAVFDEFVQATPLYKNLSHAVLGDRGRWYPCPDPASEGEKVLFSDTFPIGRARLVAAESAAAPELTDDDWPFILNTGRQLEHWHTGVMTRRSSALDAIAPEARVELHPQDAAALQVADGDWVRVRSRRGSVSLKANLTDAVARGTLFIPMHFREAAANLLTNPSLDPLAKIPEFKICAVQVEPLRL